MRFLVIIFLFIPHLARAQSVAITNGRVITSDTVYCLYEEVTNPPLTDPVSYPFNDYIIDASDSEQFIKINARTLVTSSGETNYYNIKMLSINKEINIKWESGLFTQYINDLVKYRVFYGKDVIEANSLALYYDWAKKPGILSHQTIKAATVKPRHAAINTDEIYDASFKNISFKEDKIFLNGNVIGVYQALAYNLKKHSPANNDKYYIIKDNTGIQVASLLISKAGANIKLWIGENPDPLYFVTKEHDEEKMLNVAIQVLLIKNILQ